MTRAGALVMRPQLSLLQLLEVAVAFSVVFTASRFAGDVFGWEYDVFLLLALFYLLKIEVTLFGRRHKSLATPAYAALLAAFVVWPISQEWNNPHVTWSGLFVFTPLIFFTIPTVSFVYSRDRRTTDNQTLMGCSPTSIFSIASRTRWNSHR